MSVTDNMSASEQAVAQRIPRKTKKLFSCLLVAVPLALALLGAGGLELFARFNPGSLAVVTDETGKKWEFPLSQDSRTVITTNRGTNTIVIANGEVFVEEADCPGGDCVSHLPISAAGQTIICLPHHLVVEVQPVGAPDAEAAPVPDTVAQ